MKRNSEKCAAADSPTPVVTAKPVAAGKTAVPKVKPKPKEKAKAKDTAVSAKAKPVAKKKAAGSAKVRGKRMAEAIAKTLGVEVAKPKRARGKGGAESPTPDSLKSLVDGPGVFLEDDHGFPAPAHLCEEKRVIWRDVIRRMFRLKSLDLEPDLDQDIIEQYVTAVYDFRKSNKFLEDMGHSYENAQGNWARFPESTVAKEAQVAIERLGTRLGLNPRARQIMNISRPSEKDAFDDDDD